MHDAREERRRPSLDGPASSPAPGGGNSGLASLGRLVPGVFIAGVVAVASVAIAAFETRHLGHPVMEALVVALLLGMAARLAWNPGPLHEPGIRFASKGVLEVAIVLLGASVDLGLLARAGPQLAFAIVAIVVGGLVVGIAAARALRLSPGLSVLVAVGNAICGNSAIVAVAPVIDSKREDVATSIAFTAVIGVVVVVALPLLIAPLGLTHYQYGVLAGLTVYAVPQVLAAAFPVSALAGDVATLVKLVRVLMLGPVVLFFAVRAGRARRRRAVAGSASGSHGAVQALPLATVVPWFIAGFLLVAALRGLGIIPVTWVSPTRALSAHLTVLAMAALGLSADVAAVARAGSRVAAAVSLSLLALVALGIAAIRMLPIP